jgi:VCBS repeat-containing protein
VNAVSATSLLVRRGSRQWTFGLSEAVVDTVRQLKAGDSVAVRYIEADGKRTAVKVTVQGTAPTKKAPYR